MPDVVSPEVRSRIMSGIRGKNTRPEILVRRGLHAAGFRFRLHDRRLPGCPDLVLAKHRAVIFVHGCFWHGHDCHLFKLPGTRREFWAKKIARNRQVDLESITALTKAGWRSAVVWECALKGKQRLGLHEIVELLETWLGSDESLLELRGVV